MTVGMASERFTRHFDLCEKATGYTFLCLNVPPKKLGIKAVDLNYQDITLEKLSIDEKRGFFYQFMNELELSVTLKTKDGKEPTIRLDAYNGRCLEVTDPFQYQNALLLFGLTFYLFLEHTTFLSALTT